MLWDQLPWEEEVGMQMLIHADAYLEPEDEYESPYDTLSKMGCLSVW